MTSLLPSQLQKVLYGDQTDGGNHPSDANKIDGHHHRNARPSSVHLQEGIHSKDLDDFLENQIDTTQEGRDRLSSMFPEEKQLGW
jgi:hypothetical protein